MTQPSATRRNNILFWVFTGLFCAFMLTSIIPNILSSPEWVEVFKQLGYPLYMLPFIGVAKLLGIIALIIPGYPRIKEWAYAGLIFDLTGALYSAIAVGDPASQWSMILIGHVLIFASYILYHKKKAVPAS